MEDGKRTGVVILGIPASALAALPLCPACYPAYAGVLSALGLTALDDTGVQTVLTVLFMGAALFGLFFKARSRRGYRPLALGAVAAALLAFGKFVVGSDPLVYFAVGVLVLSGLWNAWPTGESACPIEADEAVQPES